MDIKNDDSVPNIKIDIAPNELYSVRENKDKIITYFVNRNNIRKLLRKREEEKKNKANNFDERQFDYDWLDAFKLHIKDEPIEAKEEIYRVLNEENSIVKSKPMLFKRLSEWAPLLNIVGTIVLGIITIILTITISESQKNIMQLAYTPIITLSNTFFQNTDTGNYDNEYVVIKNNGYPIKNISVVYDTYVTFSIIGDTKKVTIPVSYYRGTEPINSDKGILLIIKGNDNNSYYYKVLDDIKKYNEGKESKITMDMFTLFKISYTEISDDKKILYYKDQKNITFDEYSKIKGLSDNKKRFFVEDIDIFEIKQLLNLK
ncbi:hypothetical protein ACLIX2_08910 [Proteus cibi]|uniref:hypothetical protein n=1 Tax=Proteus cibi TaxID=2050966 RepID=UPI000D68844D|nr:hypothetical protein [Proteus cibi]